MAGTTLFPQVERRHNLRLRDLFEEAYERVAPCLDPRQTWGRVPLEHLAFRMLREAYPELPPQEVHLLVCASVRVYRQRMRDQAEHLPRPEEIVMPQAAV
jgi:hypothetical protein